MLRNIGSNWVLTTITIAATYVLTPFVIHTLGQDGYGTWTLITALTGYMNLLALGVPMACVRYLAQHVTERDPAQTNRVIGSCVGLYLIIGAAALVIGLAMTAALTVVYGIPASLQAQARVACAVMVLQVSLGFIGLLPEGIMFAHHDFVVRNVVRIAAVLLRLALTLGLLATHASLVALAAVQLATLVFDFSTTLLLIRRRYPEVRVRLCDFEWRTVRRIFSFSMYVLLLGAGARLSFETDALVIGAILGVAAIPFYAVANSLIVYLMEFTIAIAAVVAPMATRLDTEGRRDALVAIFLKWSKISLSLTLMAGLFLIVLGPRFIGWWIAPDYERPAGVVLQILMISCFAFLPVRGVALPILMGLGKPRTPTIAFLATGVLNLVLSIALARPLGLAGVALGTAIPNGLFAAVVLVVACRELGIGVAAYLRYVVPRAATGAVPPLALLIWFKSGVQVQSFSGMVAAGASMLVLFVITWLLFVYRGDPYVDVTPRRLFGWSRA
ncbi:MAG TPA: oligosaccharide flippase family protein [Vicinamibacterales bacterium]|jgi:O-antigen/teichoic acid export membrane protein|nr:oligosaccharide flippase family protein [Vicinamibacterales bacterium]